MYNGLSLLLLFVLVHAVSCSQGVVITCHDQHDLNHFLYKICSQSHPCKHLFHLYPLTPSDASHLSATLERSAFIDYRNERDAQLFARQLTAKPIFPLLRKHQQHTTVATVLHNTMPAAWLPTISVHFDAAAAAAVACSDNESLYSPLTVMTALHAMHVYKLTVADEFFCHDPNERLLIDPATNESVCVCKTGKSCDNDSNFDELFTFLLVILIFGIAAFIMTVFVSLFYKRSMIYDLWGSSSSRL